MDFDQEAADYIHELEFQVYELRGDIRELKEANIELARENTVLNQQLEEYRGPL